MSMDAGRELDAKLAQALGLPPEKWPWECHAEDHTMDERTWCFDCEMIYNEGERIPPPASTRIEYAFEVVDRLDQPVSIYKHVDGSYTVRIGSWSPVAGKEPTMARAQTAPHAICLAAIKALEGRS